MRVRFLLVLAFLMYFLVSAVCQAKGDLSVNRTLRTRKQQLRLTTSVIDQKYCNNGSLSLRIKLLLRYKNVGTESVVLYKGASLVSSYLISHSAKAAAARNYVQVVRLEIKSSEEPNHFDTAGPGDDFIILQPNIFYTVESEVDIPIAESANPNPDFLRAGTYFLQIKVSTWSESKNLARRLRNRWQQSGVLWFNDIVSQPMLFTVEKQPKIVDCQ